MIVLFLIIMYCIPIYSEDFGCKKNLQIVIKNSWQYKYAFTMTKKTIDWNVFITDQSSH